MHRVLFLVTAVFAIGLGALLIFAPTAYLDLYLDGGSAERAFAAQRLAPAIMGLGGLLFILRSLEPGPMLRNIAWVAAAVWFGVAATGIYHFSIGMASTTILVAAAIECVLGLLFLLAARQDRA